MNYLSHIFAALLITTPMIGAAADAPRNLQEMMDLFMGMIELLILLIFTLTFFMFIWGMVKGWIFHGAEASGQEEGKKVLVAGLIGLVVMFSVWGLVGLIKSSLFGW